MSERARVRVQRRKARASEGSRAVFSETIPVSSAAAPSTVPAGYGHDFTRIPIQAKLTVSAPDDAHELEADRVASQVVSRLPAQPEVRRQEEEEEVQAKRAPDAALRNVQRQEEEEEVQTKLLPGTPGPVLQRQGEEEEEVQAKRDSVAPITPVQRQEEEEEVQAMPVPGGGLLVGAGMESAIVGAQGGGAPLARAVRQPMEAAFGADFGGVKVHTDGTADTLNRGLQARAFTTGQNIFFRSGEYDPRSRGGQELLAHELTHVVQQTGAKPRSRR
jgi:hypothetical protein